MGVNSRCAFIIQSLSDEMDDEKFSDWEREFMANMDEQLELYSADRIDYVLSDKQIDCLERIWRKF